ncbi:MAG: penicillin-binding protein 2 [Gammaproteobacteria bacterium]|nr:penicillin-binding protein 2 [Gammaproteobacteria bacterium]
MKQKLTIKNTTQEKRCFKYRLVTIGVGAIILIGLLFIRLVYLQIDQHYYYQTLSDKNKIDLVPIPPRRGIIYDRHGEILAKNIAVFSLVVIPDRAKHLKKSLEALRTIIPISPADLEEFDEQLKEHRRFDEIPLKIELSDKEVARFAINRYRFPGFFVKAELIRNYPLGQAFAHVVGYVGRINIVELDQIDTSNYAGTNFIGKVGIEKYYEPQLHGKVGYKKIETDAAGHIIRTLEMNSSESGSDLYLTIDSKLQLVAEQALGDERGAVVAIQPSTGQVLVLASKPSYDPNLFVTGISNQDYQTLQNNEAHPLFNRTVRGLYAPGSTIKPFIALEGLNSQVVTPAEKIFDPGWYRVPNTEHVFHDWKKGGHGWVNISKAIIESCDTFFFNLAYQLGIGRIDYILDLFGFGKMTGIDINEELVGNIPTPEWKMRYVGLPWYTGDTVLCAIGQSYVQVTPLQLAVATATLANRGEILTPYLLYALKRTHHPVAKQLPILKDKLLFDQSEWDIVVKAMSLVTRLGTGYHFGRTSYTVAAKTGTAQVVSRRFKEDENVPYKLRPDSWFIAFAPVNHPKIAIAVLTEHSDSAPIVARKVLDYYLLKEM